MQGAHGQHLEQEGKGQRDIAEEDQAVLAQLRHQVQAELDHQRRRGLRQAMEDLVLQQIVDPVQRRLAPEQPGGMQDHITRDPAEHQRHDQQQRQAQPGLQQGMLIEGAEKVLGAQPELFDIHG